MVRTYLDWLIELPWSKLDAGSDRHRRGARASSTRTTTASTRSRRASSSTSRCASSTRRARSPILCFVGPPGVGKTSLGQSIARALGLQVRARQPGRRARRGGDPRPPAHLHRRDARQHHPERSARPARATRCSCSTRSTSSARGFHGDPSAALLEVLDPEQNSTFRDNYLDVPFDLSQGAVHRHGERARHDSGAAARPHGGHRAPRLHGGGEARRSRRATSCRASSRRTGSSRSRCEITDAALRPIIDDYTREAGVRNLEREIGAVLRNAAVRIAEGTASSVRDRRRRPARDPRRRARSRTRSRCAPACRASRPASRGRRSAATSCSSRRRACPGSGQLILTGQLGDVMKESAQAALTLVKARARDARRRRRACSRRTTCTSTCRRARSRRTARARAWRCSSRWRRCSPAAGARRRRDDGRDQPARPRAADRRHQGEGARGAARGHRARCCCRRATSKDLEDVPRRACATKCSSCSANASTRSCAKRSALTS